MMMHPTIERIAGIDQVEKETRSIRENPPKHSLGASIGAALLDAKTIGVSLVMAAGFVMAMPAYQQGLQGTDPKDFAIAAGVGVVEAVGAIGLWELIARKSGALSPSQIWDRFSESRKDKNARRQEVARHTPLESTRDWNKFLTEYPPTDTIMRRERGEGVTPETPADASARKIHADAVARRQAREATVRHAVGCQSSGRYAEAALAYCVAGGQGCEFPQYWMNAVRCYQQGNDHVAAYMAFRKLAVQVSQNRGYRSNLRYPHIVESMSGELEKLQRGAGFSRDIESPAGILASDKSLLQGRLQRCAGAIGSVSGGLRAQLERDAKLCQIIISR